MSIVLEMSSAEVLWVVQTVSYIDWQNKRRRLIWLGAQLDKENETFHMGFSVAELWLIDLKFQDVSLRADKLSDGQLVLTFAEKVWEALIEAEGGRNAHNYEDRFARKDDTKTVLQS